MRIKTNGIPKTVDHNGVYHREITVIEVQRLVVLGCTALFTMKWQLRIHVDRDEGW